jgi:hypothetical protein
MDSTKGVDIATIRHLFTNDRLVDIVRFVFVPVVQNKVTNQHVFGRCLGSLPLYEPFRVSFAFLVSDSVTVQSLQPPSSEEEGRG